VRVLLPPPEFALAKNYTLRGTITRDLVVPVTGGVSQVTGPSAPGRTEDENRRRG
jgi:hypothetical protein